MELFAVLDVLIHIFHDIFGEGRSEQAAMAKGAMAEFRAALAPGDDFAAIEVFADFVMNLIVAGHIAIDDFAVVEDGFDFLRGRLRAESERSEGSAAGMASEFFAREKTGADRGAGISCNGLDMNIFETAAKFQRADKEHIQKDPTGNAERICARRFAEMIGKGEDEFLEKILSAASDVGAERSIDWRARFGEAGFAIEARRKDAAAVVARSEVAAVKNGQAFRIEGEEFAKCLEEFGPAIFADPLELVFITIGAKAEILRYAQEKPADGVWKRHVVEGLDAVVFAESDEAGAGHGAFVESEDEGAVEAGSVVGAGSVRKMMIETQDAVAAEELAELLKGGIGRRRLFCAGGEQFGERYG